MLLSGHVQSAISLEDVTEFTMRSGKIEQQSCNSVIEIEVFAHNVDLVKEMLARILGVSSVPVILYKINNY